MKDLKNYIIRYLKLKVLMEKNYLKVFIMTYMLLNQKTYLLLTFKTKLDLLEKEVMVT